MVVIREDPILDKHEYFGIGIQYYIAGRASFLCGLMPVCGNLLHHATEMFLLSGLVTKYSPEDLKKKYHKHSLPQMWSDFKNLFPKENLIEFDDFINSLNQWEELRYPVRKDHDVSMLFARDKTLGLPKIQKMKGRKSREYTITLEEADEFFRFIIRPLSVNSDYLKTLLSFGFEDRLETCKKYNKHMIWD